MAKGGIEAIAEKEKSEIRRVKDWVYIYDCPECNKVIKSLSLDQIEYQVKQHKERHLKQKSVI